MPRYSYRAKKRQEELVRELAYPFDAAALHNRAGDALGQDDQLWQLLEAWAETEQALAAREDAMGWTADGSRCGDLDDAVGTIDEVVRDRAREVVADACVEVIEHGDEWAADGHLDEAAIADAVHEAREWLQTNHEVAERVGSLEPFRSDLGTADE